MAHFLVRPDCTAGGEKAEGLYLRPDQAAFGKRQIHLGCTLDDLYKGEKEAV